MCGSAATADTPPYPTEALVVLRAGMVAVETVMLLKCRPDDEISSRAQHRDATQFCIP